MLGASPCLVSSHPSRGWVFVFPPLLLFVCLFVFSLSPSQQQQQLARRSSCRRRARHAAAASDSKRFGHRRPSSCRTKRRPRRRRRRPSRGFFFVCFFCTPVTIHSIKPRGRGVTGLGIKSYRSNQMTHCRTTPCGIWLDKFRNPASTLGPGDSSVSDLQFASLSVAPVILYPRCGSFRQHFVVPNGDLGRLRLPADCLVDAWSDS